MNGRVRLLAKGLLPPIFQDLLKRAPSGSRRKEQLFDGSDAMFKRVVGAATSYGEYGCGRSTEWVIANTCARVVAVDTSKDWIEFVKNTSNQSERLNAHYVDVGRLAAWGRPESYAHREHFVDYTDWIWEQEPKPQVVLIDGRFRVACFLTTLLRATPGTTIIFDDYLNRSQYHIVEELVPRVELCGRQCRFVVPTRDKLDATAAEELLERFRYVMD